MMRTGKQMNRIMKIMRIALVFVFIFAAGPVFAQRTITIRMASPVPENTPWGEFFNQLAAEWRRITNGQVELIIFHNSVAGTEKEVVRNLRVNQLQAAVLSVLGLHEISREVITLSCPFLIRNDEELDLVLGELKEELESKINGQRFYTLAWARIDWVKFFSKQPVFVPADLKRMKFGIYSDQEEMGQAFKAVGFQLVPVPRNDILVALNSNMVDAIFSSPAGVGSTQVFGLAKNMASINVAPFVGAIVFNRQAWNAIPERFKPELIAATRRIETELDRSVRGMEGEILKMMENYGLVVNQLSPAQEQLWYEEFERAIPSIVGSLGTRGIYYDRGIYERIQTLLRNHRSGRR